jgi:outer membrane immunogenic protein
MKQQTHFTLAAAVFCAAVLFTASTASAGPERMSSKEVAPVMEQEFSWTGFYIGGNLGANWTNYKISRIDTDFDVDAADAAIDQSSDSTEEFFGFDSFTIPGNFGSPISGVNSIDLGTSESLTGGGQVGYQYQWGHFVFGVEGDFNRTGNSRWASFDHSFAIPAFASDNGRERADLNFDISRKVETDWEASARARLGYARGPILIYVTGGVAFADVNVTASDSGTLHTSSGTFQEGTGTFDNLSKVDDIQIGWTAGGGIEWAVHNCFTIGIEGRHADFGSETYNFNSHGGPLFSGPTKVSMESDMVLLRFNVLLNHFFGSH